MAATTKRLTKAEIHALAEGFIKAMNAHDTDAALSYCTDDVVFKEPFSPVMRDKEKIRPLMIESFKAFKEYQIPLEDVEVYLGDDRTSAVVTYTMIVTISGPEAGLPATGRTVRAKVALIVKFRDGLISEGLILYDSEEAAEQAGLLPRFDSLAMKLIMAGEMVATRARKALRL